MEVVRDKCRQKAPAVLVLLLRGSLIWGESQKNLARCRFLQASESSQVVDDRTDEQNLFNIKKLEFAVDTLTSNMAFGRDGISLEIICNDL